MRRLAVIGVLVCVLVGGVAAEPTGARSLDGELAGYGVAAVLPAGWHGRMSRGVLESATSRLPPLGQWIASSLSKSLGREDVGVVLYEDAPQPGASLGIYRPGRPRPFASGDFGGPPLGGSNPGQHRFVRRNFTVAGRYFDLFVETGAVEPTRSRLAQLNDLVRSLRFRRGDFYPGTVNAASFASYQGWRVRHSPIVPLAPETVATSVASTVAYREPLIDFPPHETLARLPADGAIIYLMLVASNRDPPIAPAGAEKNRVTLRLPANCGSFEGVPAAVSVCPLHALVDRQYTIDGWVIFGRTNATAAQRARAQAELGRFRLPSWPRWPS